MLTDGVRAQALSAPTSSACCPAGLLLTWLLHGHDVAATAPRISSVCKAGKGIGQNSRSSLSSEK